MIVWLYLLPSTCNMFCSNVSNAWRQAMRHLILAKDTLRYAMTGAVGVCYNYLGLVPGVGCFSQHCMMWGYLPLLTTLVMSVLLCLFVLFNGYCYFSIILVSSHSYVYGFNI